MKELQRITSRLRQEENIKTERLKREEQQRKIKIEARQEAASELEEEPLVDCAAAAEPAAIPAEPVCTEALFKPTGRAVVLDMGCVELAGGLQESARPLIMHDLITTGQLFAYQAPSPPLLQLLFTMTFQHAQSHEASCLLLRHYAEQGRGACWFPQLRDFYDALVALGYVPHAGGTGSSGGGGGNGGGGGSGGGGGKGTAPPQQPHSGSDAAGAPLRVANLKHLLRLLGGVAALHQAGMYDLDFSGGQQAREGSGTVDGMLLVALLRLPLDPRVAAHMLPDVSNALGALLRGAGPQHASAGWDDRAWACLLEEASSALATRGPSHRGGVAMLTQLAGSRGPRVTELLQHGAAKLVKELLGGGQGPSAAGSRRKALDIQSVKDLFAKTTDTFLVGERRDYHKIQSVFEAMHLLIWSLTFCSTGSGHDRAGHASWLIGTFVKRVGRAVESHHPVCITIKGMIPALQSLYADYTESQ
ncbi:MAG: hypothetical protein WDW38_008381 [Sanguina aurantia]